MDRQEMLMKAREANSPEELIAIAKEHDIKAAEEEIKAYYESIHKAGEVADDELDNVVGGVCYHPSNGDMRTMELKSCCNWKCPECGCYHDYGNCSIHSREGARYCIHCKFCYQETWGSYYCTYHTEK